MLTCTCIAPNTDTVHITSLEMFIYYVEIDVTPRYFRRWPREYVHITMKGETKNYGDYKTYIPRGTVVVIWNVRSMARQSFERAFNNLYDVHKPFLIVITQEIVTWQD